MDVEYRLSKPLFVRSLDHQLGRREPAVAVLAADLKLVYAACEWPPEHLG